MYMVIQDIQNLRTGKTRTDGRYPDRIGSTVRFAFNEVPEPGRKLLLSYEKDRYGQPKEGLIIATTIRSVVHERGFRYIIDTLNSRYFLDLI